MPTDLTATSGIPPTNPSVPLPTSRALVPVAPVAPRPLATPSGSPLDRSGLALLDVLGEPDTLVARSTTVRVALDAGLEEARGALVRNQPGDALAALDRVWDGARHTEQGWYLRGGSLTLLGLPGEAERVVGDAVASQPASSALRFLQSIARLALGDLAGARATLAVAMQQRPSDPLLMVQQALVIARQGDRATAHGLLMRAATLAPEHPAIAYGRAALRMANADAARAMHGGRWGQSGAHVVIADGEGTPLVEVATPAPSTTSTAGRNAGIAEPDSAMEPVMRPPAGDASVEALRRLAIRIATLPQREAAAETRVLLRAFSSGGALAATITPERAHAARTVLAALVSALGSAAEEYTPGPLLNVTSILARELVAALRSNRLDVASHVVHRASAVMSEPLAACLRSMLEGVSRDAPAGVPRGTPAEGALRTSEGGKPHGSEVPDAPRPGTRTPTYGSAATDDTRGTPTPVRGGEHDRTPLTSLRLGLGLLPDERAQALAFAVGSRVDAAAGEAATAPGAALSRDGALALSGTAAMPYVNERAPGWGANVAWLLTSRTVMGAGPHARTLAVVCVAMALGAFSVGYAPVGFALAGGALWLALRRGPGMSTGIVRDESTRRGPDEMAGR